jgi:predicted deacetylase
VPVHVSIHDVSPAPSSEVEEALELCARAGARPALLVVPRRHGDLPLLDCPRLCARLRALQALGHEVYLHGLTHRGGAPPRAGLTGRLRWAIAQRVLSAGEAELSGLSPEEVQRQVEDGERVLHDAGLTVDGYVPPAWVMPRWMPALLAARGYRFAEDRLRVYDPMGRTARPTVVLNWASRSPARLLSTVAFCRIARRARSLLPARIAIHPADLRVLLLRREIERHLAWARGDFVTRGRDLCAA